MCANALYIDYVCANVCRKEVLYKNLWFYLV